MNNDIFHPLVFLFRSVLFSLKRTTCFVLGKHLSFFFSLLLLIKSFRINMALRSSSRSSAHSYEQKKHRFARSLSSDISLSALSYQTSERMKSLSKPRLRRETHIRTGKNKSSRTNHHSIQ